MHFVHEPAWQIKTHMNRVARQQRQAATNPGRGYRSEAAVSIMCSGQSKHAAWTTRHIPRPVATDSPRTFPPTAFVLADSPGHDATCGRARVRMPVALLPRTLVTAAVWPNTFAVEAMEQPLAPRSGVVLALRIVIHAQRAFWSILDPTTLIILSCAGQVQMQNSHANSIEL